MKPRPAAVRPPPAPPYRRWVGIDPGATVGLCALVVPNDGPHACDIDHAKLLGARSITATSSQKFTSAGRRATMLTRVRAQLIDWQITDAVLEEPSTQTNSWQAAKGEGRQTGSLFFLGAHYGLCLGAVATMPWPVRVWAYPTTTSKKARNDPESDDRLGWMQARAPRPTRKQDTLDAMARELRKLKGRPANGVLPSIGELARVHVEHELMALGVLRFHLLRELGKV
jgi:hypothetical protein